MENVLHALAIQTSCRSETGANTARSGQTLSVARCDTCRSTFGHSAAPDCVGSAHAPLESHSWRHLDELARTNFFTTNRPARFFTDWPTFIECPIGESKGDYFIVRWAKLEPPISTHARAGFRAPNWLH